MISLQSQSADPETTIVKQ